MKSMKSLYFTSFIGPEGPINIETAVIYETYYTFVTYPNVNVLRARLEAHLFNPSEETRNLVGASLHRQACDLVEQLTGVDDVSLLIPEDERVLEELPKPNTNPDLSIKAYIVQSSTKVAEQDAQEVVVIPTLIGK